MTRAWGALLLFGVWSGVVLAQQPKYQEPPEEDEGLVEKEYSFNPLQASRELRVGSFYFKKGSYRAAAGRFREATKWNPGFAEAWLRLGDAHEKMMEAEQRPEEKRKAAESMRQAYAKYLELAPESKEADSVKKKLGEAKP